MTIGEEFEQVAKFMQTLNDLEDDIKGFRDEVGETIKTPINEALRCIGPLRDKLWAIDKAIEQARDALRKSGNGSVIRDGSVQ